jgi:Amt family ammonium transporter
MKTLSLLTGSLVLAVLALVDPALAQEEAVDYSTTGVPLETQYILNTFSFLIHGALVMWMAAGFAMLESGLVRSKNTAAICLKNIALYSTAGIMYYLIGYDIMYPGDFGGYIGLGGFLYDSPAAELAMIGGEGTAEYLAGNGYSVMSDWFFQMVFVATAASIVSGTLAERIKVWPFLLFVVLLTGFIYPIQGSWVWGGGWLDAMGFSDFAGSTLVHSVGGWAALTGAIILGARTGKYNPDGSVNAMPGANLPLATLGTFILWLGWFGFNGGSELALGTAGNAANMAIVYANTNLAAAGGVVAAAILSQLVYKKLDLTMVLNGAIAGLVSITANPDLPSTLSAIIVGAIGGGLVVFAVPFFDKLKIDDVVGAISAHLVAGVWGTLAVALFSTDATIVAQITGIVAIGIFVVVTSAIAWFIVKLVVGLRVSDEEEDQGLDKAELGLEAYPEFGQGSMRM